MTAIELEYALRGSSGYIARHRPMLLQIQVMLCVVGCFFYTVGVIDSSVFKADTWGALIYHQPAWFWGAWNAAAGGITAIGLTRPVRSKMVCFGAFLHVLQFSAISISCVWYGGDMGIGIYASCMMAIHSKLFYEAAR